MRRGDITARYLPKTRVTGHELWPPCPPGTPFKPLGRNYPALCTL